MVAKITVPITINRALNYNEQKVQKGMAKCIHANGFLKEADQLIFLLVGGFVVMPCQILQSFSTSFLFIKTGRYHSKFWQDYLFNK